MKNNNELFMEESIVMGLKQTIKAMHTHLDHLKKDLVKAEGGTKAASQRVRTGSIQFAKLAKTFRKESVKSEKVTKKKPASKKAAPKRKAPAKKKATKKKVVKRKKARR